MIQCAYHVCSRPSGIYGRGRYCSKSCASKHLVYLRRRRLKELAIAYMGGECALCGYSRCASSLDFHHLDSALKEYSISDSGATRGWSVIKKELDKCLMVCRNCYGEIHDGQHPHSVLEHKASLALLRRIDLEPPATPKPTKQIYDPHAPRLDQRKTMRPSREELQEKIEAMSWIALGRYYGVSDNAVRKWARSYGLEIKPRKRGPMLA